MTREQRETVSGCMAAIDMAAAILAEHPEHDVTRATLNGYGMELGQMLEADEARAKVTDEADKAIRQAISVMMLAKGDFWAEGSLKRAGELENAIERLRKIL